MTDSYWDRLIHAHLDATLTEGEQREFESLMRDSEAARSRFWELAEVHGLAGDAVRIAWPDADVESTPASLPGKRTDPSWLRPAGLVAAGLLMGVLMTSLTWAITRPEAKPSRVLLSESFETDTKPAADGVPTTTNVWSGDFAEVVAAQADVRPAGDQKMLRFLSADYEGKPNPGGYIGDLYRLIDVRSFRQELADGNAVAQVSAAFNAAPWQGDKTYRCSVSVFALDRAMLNDSAMRNATTLVDRALATTRRSNDLLDNDSATWQTVSADLRLPPDSDYLLVRIAVAHGHTTRNSTGHESFPAHFADDVRVTLVRREPLP